MTWEGDSERRARADTEFREGSGRRRPPRGSGQASWRGWHLSRKEDFQRE